MTDDLVALASKAAGGERNVSQLVRLGLATLAGVDVADHTPPRRGWPKGRPRKVVNKDMAGAA